MGSQRLAAIPTISEATQPALGLLEEIKKNCLLMNNTYLKIHKVSIPVKVFYNCIYQ